MINKFNIVLIFNLLIFSCSLMADDREPKIQTLQKGVQFTLVAEHPDIVTPTGVDVDEKGRVWVISSHTHFPPEDYKGPKFDEILILDKGKRTVFYNATHHTMDLELGKDGWIYLAERSRILRIKDSNQDGKADLVENLAVLKTEAVYPHNGLAGLAWDLNGDLIFCLGENFSKPWTLTGTDKTIFNGSSEGGVFRIKADGTELKRIARGLWNPFGICVRKNGELFAVDNDPGERPPCRLLHIVQGGDYGFQRVYGSEAHHPFVCWNGELRGTLPMVHPVGEAPCGIVSFRQGLLSPSWGDHHVCFYHLTPKGAGYSAKPIHLIKGSRYFRPTCIAPDSHEKRKNIKSWYISDWVDGRYNVHGYGRLWKLEINTDEADWIGPTELQSKTKNALLTDQLRSGNHSYSLEEVLDYSLDEDPYLAQAALLSLSYQASKWKIPDIEKQPVQKRIQMLLALKKAALLIKNTINTEQWVQYFLADKNIEIQFETLRWISDSQLKEYLPVVEKILEQSDLEYNIFEAAIATWNMLNGKPEAGIRNEEMLLKRVQDSSSSPRIRTFALRLLPAHRKMATDKNISRTSFPKGLSIKLIKELIAVEDPELTLEAVRTLSRNPKLGEKLLKSIAVIKNYSIQIRAEAIAGLAALSIDHIDILLELASDNEQEIREEALRSLRQTKLSPAQMEQIKLVITKYPESADVVRVLLNPDILTKDRPPLEDISGWDRRLKSIPGTANINVGRRLFHHSKVASCSLCHRFQGLGNTVGPDLSSVNTRNDRKWLLESILQPSREMSPEFRPSTILLVDGRSFTGIRLQSYTKEAIRDNQGQKRVFDRSEIEMIKDLDQSFMPNGLVHLMTDRELRDLVGFLSSIKK
jgi:putative membrane-bound dehydrogenase-like protein